MVTIHLGDCIDVMRGLPDGTVNCCVTSPPYFGLRDYGVSGQIGLEPTPDAFVEKMVQVFREVRRLLRDDGTLWLNLGDSYSAHPGQRKETDKAGPKQQSKRGSTGSPSRCVDRLKPKDLIGIPWRVAFALQADGWYLRQDIIWHKPNPMPESVTDRCTKAHEYIFLLSKSARYYYDAGAIKEPANCNPEGPNAYRGQAAIRPRGQAKKHRMPAGWATHEGSHGNFHKDGRAQSVEYSQVKDDVRNKRSVWTVATKPYSEAHFATFPPDLIRPCILAGCPAGGTVLDPFGGSGTTGEVAEHEGRNSVLIELNPDYINLARKRTAQGGLFCNRA